MFSRTSSILRTCPAHARALACLTVLLTGCAATDAGNGKAPESATPRGATAQDDRTLDPALTSGTFDRANDIVLILHGGVGTLDPAEMSPALEAEFRSTLTAALRAGEAARAGGAPPADAVRAAVRLLEDSPLFNAGRGAVLTNNRRHELDASLMVGAGPEAGAVAGVTTVRHPIDLAWYVLEETPHVMLAGPAADGLALSLGPGRIELVPNDWFTTPHRVEQLNQAMAAEARRTSLAEDPRGAPGIYFGTVGAVARDDAGHLASGTSTGGMTNKRFGRVGDSPIIGAGTWADDRTVGISCTGHGEFFIRGAVAHDVHSRMLHAHQELGAAAAGTLAELTERGGEGGFIALTPTGEALAAFNTPGMYRGWLDAAGRITVRIWGERK